MAAELGQFLRDQLSSLPNNHPDRPLLESMLGTTQAYLLKPVPVSKPEKEFEVRPNSRRDLYLEGANGLLDQFSQNARICMYLAEVEAKSLGHNYIGTEHILLGIIKEGGNAKKVLSNLGAEADKVIPAVKFIIGRGESETRGVVSFTPRGRRVINLAADEATRLNSVIVDSQELLLGLVREGEGIAAGVLESLGVNLERTRVEVRRMFPPQT